MKSLLRHYLSVFTFLCFILIFVKQCDSRHLPTRRSQDDNLERLKELMYHILELSNENVDERLNNLNSYLPPQSSSLGSSSGLSGSRPSWSKQNLLDFGIPPQLITSSKTQYGRNSLNLDDARLY